MPVTVTPVFTTSAPLHDILWSAYLAANAEAAEAAEAAAGSGESSDLANIEDGLTETASLAYDAYTSACKVAGIEPNQPDYDAEW